MAKAKKTTKKPVIKAAGDPPVCPTGQYWNGTRCVDNVGK